jgi:hypothetical protein
VPFYVQRALGGTLVFYDTSGQFGVFANGPGTAQFDSFRVTQYPDPSLSLAAVLPRLGSSSVSWTPTTPPNTIATIKISMDGLTWTDVTSQNGGILLGLTVQPAPTIDLFTSNTSANYTNTNKSGGSTSTPTFDTTNSRLILAGGSGGLYLYSSITWADVDIMAVMDESDAGGLVWRYVDANNYYELGCYDDTASGGFTNALRLYKVVAGTRSLIGSASVVAWPRSTIDASPYKTVRVTMLGTAITVYFDGVVMQTATDSAFMAGLLGLRNDGGTSRYYQLRLQPQGDYVSGTPAGDTVTGGRVYTQVTLTTTDPSVAPTIQDLTTSAHSPQIARGALIPQLHTQTTPVAIPFNTEMDTLAAASGDFWWDISSASSLTFCARNAVPAPWALYSTDLIFTPAVQPTNGADLYRNRQNIINCIDTIINSEQKIADGTATSWSMSYPLYSAPVITVQSVAQSVGVQGVDTGKNFYWQVGSASISQDSSSGAVKIPSGYLLQFSYVGQFTRTVTEDNLAEQAARQAVEGGTGIVEATLDGKGMLASNAIIYAQGLLAKHSNNNTVEFIGSTQRTGLAPGQLQTFFVPDHSINNAQLLIVKLTTTGQQQLDGSVLYEYQVDATNGSNLNNWADVFFGS